MFKFHNESGRSMVEMLGTLAIMGVLTVGGISGYTTAMNNHKANEALNDAKRLAMMISSERMLGKTGTLDSKEYEKGLYTFSQRDDQGKIVLTVQDIPSGVANKLNKMKDDLQIADIIIADNNVTFEFMNDLSGKPSAAGTDQNQGEEGQSGNQGGSTSTPETPQQPADPCSQCLVVTSEFSVSYCEGANCSGCLVPVDQDTTGTSCVPTSSCEKICGGYCFDVDSFNAFGACCSAADGGGGTCANYNL